ncbi:histidine phosphatase family protein [Dialister sp.]|uniref:histidine phosphatase family protein n=1 Tax=Dialister sp. TaxID=1955814 RepID=UPI003F08E7F5
MTTVYMVRHGETDWNAAHRMQGWSDIPLNERGRAQAACAAAELASVPFHAVYTSPLKRAVETADVIRGKKPIPLIPEQGLIEINLGRWDGHTPDEMDILYPGQYDLWRSCPGDVHIDGGETFAEVQERAWKAFLQILRNETGKTVLLVSHMGCLSTILFRIAGYPLNDLWKHPIGNAALCRILVKEDGTMTIEEWGRDDYIPENLKLKVPFGRLKNE